MTLDQLIAIANTAYDDDLIAQYHQHPNEPHGDTLARFIAVELSETFDPTASDVAQLEEAARVMKSAAGQLFRVWNALVAVQCSREDAGADRPQ